MHNNWKFKKLSNSEKNLGELMRHINNIIIFSGSFSKIKSESA